MLNERERMRLHPAAVKEAKQEVVETVQAVVEPEPEPEPEVEEVVAAEPEPELEEVVTDG